MMVKIKNNQLLNYTKQLVCRYKDDDLPGLSAQITHYLILAFFPFLLFLINIISFTALSNDIIVTGIVNFLPTETGAMVKSVLIETAQAKSTALLLLGMLASLWASSKGISAIIKGLNKAYGIKEDRSFIHLTLVSVIATLGVSTMIIFSFVMIIFGKIIGNAIFGFLGATEVFEILWSVLRYCIPILFMLITFFLLYTYVPNKKLEYKNVIIGTVFTTFGWIVTSGLFSLYVNNFSNYSRVYGSLGGLIALIIWLNISSQIILVGGELNAIRTALKNE